MKQEIIDRLNEAEKDGEITTYILITDKCFSAQGKTIDILSLIVQMTSEFIKEGFDKEAMRRACEIGIAYKEFMELPQEKQDKIEGMLEEMEKVVNE